MKNGVQSSKEQNMKTLKNFIDNQAEELLQQSDLTVITGGETDNKELSKDLNIFSDCQTTNNCHGGLCSGHE